MKLKKIIGMMSNIASLVLVGPVSIWFAFLGLLFLTYGLATLSVASVIFVIAGILFLCTPVFCIVGIILSIIFRRKNQYKKSYLIQLLPVASVIAGIVLTFVSMICGNL